MGPTKIMIIRHAEKPVTTNGLKYNGINEYGDTDDESLIPQGWERAGGIANLFFPIDNLIINNTELATPSYIYASDPTVVSIGEKEPSKRPYQTISALYEKMSSTINGLATLNITNPADQYATMVTDVLNLPLNPGGIVLIAWQHQDILPHPADKDKPATTDGIVLEFLKQTNTPTNPYLNIPTGPWPGDRYDMVFVLDRDPNSGFIVKFTQVPQMLLAGDKIEPFPDSPWVKPNS